MTDNYLFIISDPTSDKEKHFRNLFASKSKYSHWRTYKIIYTSSNLESDKRIIDECSHVMIGDGWRDSKHCNDLVEYAIDNKKPFLSKV